MKKQCKNNEEISEETNKEISKEMKEQNIQQNKDDKTEKACDPLSHTPFHYIIALTVAFPA